MRLRNIAGSEEIIAQSPYVVQSPVGQRGHWAEVFGNGRPIYMEIGMGKGRFLMELAEKNPQNNYIGLERYTSVLLRAVQKMEEKPLENLKFLCMKAEEICEVFAPGEIAGIYLNFSDPWPKDRHARRRLPSREFLQRYDQILAPGGQIEFKTDNRELFFFALEELEPAGWQLVAKSCDLHKDALLGAGNILTEYEEKFSAMGNPIYKYIISR